MSRQSSRTSDLPPLNTNITGSLHVASPKLFRSPTSTLDDEDDSHKPLQDFKLRPRDDGDHDHGPGSGSGSGFGDEYRYLLGSGSSAGMMPGSPMFTTDNRQERTLSGSIDYPVKMVAGSVTGPVPGGQKKRKVGGPVTSASLFLISGTGTGHAIEKGGMRMERDRRSGSAPPSIGALEYDTASHAGLGEGIAHTSQGTYLNANAPWYLDPQQDVRAADSPTVQGRSRFE